MQIKVRIIYCTVLHFTHRTTRATLRMQPVHSALAVMISSPHTFARFPRTEPPQDHTYVRGAESGAVPRAAEAV